MSKRLRSALCVGAAAVLLAACGSDDSARTAEPPVPGGTLIQAVVRPASIDPALAQTVSERVIADQLYDGLTVWDTRSGKALPALAERWEPAQDNKQWTFHLRDAQAGNGEPVTSADVKSTLQRIARKSAGSPSADLLSAVVGFKDFSSNDSVADLAGVVAVDPKTVRIDLDYPLAEIPELMGNPTFGIVHKAGDGASITTGPMAIGDATDPNTLRLKKAPGSKSYVEGAEVRYFNDIASAYAAFERQEVQWAPVPGDKADEAADRYGKQLYRESLRTLFLSFNLSDARFADVRFREAIVRAIDRNGVEDKLGIQGTEVLNGVVPSGVEGSQNGGCGSLCTFDENRARDLVKQVFPNDPPPPITMQVVAGPPLGDEASRQIADNLSKVGITVDRRPIPADQYSAVTVSPDRQLFQANWSAAYPSPDAFLTPLFFSGFDSNVGVFKDQKFEDTILAAEKESDTSARDRLYQEAERRVMELLPIVPIAQFPVTSVAASNVRGLDPQPTGNFNIADVWLANTPPS